jgi:hypothetical protein
VESSLADTYQDIIGGVAFDLGWVRSLPFVEANLRADKLATLKMVVKGGLQQFYNPPPDQTGHSHQWSFLKPVAQFTLASGSRVVRLPDDYKGIDGELVHVLISSGGYSLKVGGNVLAKYAMYPSTTGRPAMIEQEGLNNPQKERGQRFQFRIWPEADADYTLQVRHSIQGEMLSGNLPYAYGGAEHSSTIRASCVAWSELHLDDILNGPKQSYWRERLATSISMDRQKQPQTMGLNLDRSDRQDFRYGDRRDSMTNWPLLTYNGSVPD